MKEDSRQNKYKIDYGVNIQAKKALTWPAIDIASLIFCFVIASVVSVMLILDISILLPKQKISNLGEIVGQIKRFENSVRYRPQKIPLWDQADQEQTLHNNDMIFTDQSSQAMLKMADGTEIELGENTLISLEKSAGAPILNVIKGSIKATVTKENPKLQIRTSDKSQPIQLSQGSSVNITKIAERDVKITVTEGTVRTGDVTIFKAQKAVFTDSGELKQLVQVRIKLITPPAHEVKVLQEKVAFSWQTDTVSTVLFELASNASFEQVLRKIQTQDTSCLLSLSPGQYFWRVSIGKKAKNDSISEVRSLKILPKMRVTPFAPLPGQIFVAEDHSQGGVELLWKKDPLIKTYSVEVWSDQPRQIVFKKSTLLNGLESPSLPVGRYWWRVLPAEYSDRNDLKFGVGADDSKTAEAAPPLSNDDGNSRSFWIQSQNFKAKTDQQKSTKSQQMPRPKEILEPPKLPAKMQIKLPSNFLGKSLKERNLSLRRCSLKRAPFINLLLTFGQAFAQEDQAPQQSQANEQANIARWPEVVGAAGYIVEIALDQKFTQTKLRKTVVLAELQDVKLPAGKYWLRVATVNQEGRFGAFSEPAALEISSSTLVSAPPENPKGHENDSNIAKNQGMRTPRLIRPLNGEKLIISQRAENQTFTWLGNHHEIVKQKVDYQVQIFLDQLPGSGSNAIIDQRTPSPYLTVELSPGRYFWRVRTWLLENQILSAKVSPWSEVSRFSLTQVWQPKVGRLEKPQSNSHDIRDESSESHSANLHQVAFNLAYVPGIYSYDATAIEPKTHVRATLYNGVSLGTHFLLYKRFGLLFAGDRTSTQLFRRPSTDDPPGQRPINLKIFGGQGGILVKAIGPASVDSEGLILTLGIERRAISRFDRREDQTLALTQQLLNGGFLAIKGRLLPFQDFGLELDIEGSVTKKAGLVGVKDLKRTQVMLRFFRILGFSAARSHEFGLGLGGAYTRAQFKTALETSQVAHITTRTLMAIYGIAL